jgi:hypothetical protein
MKGQPWMDKPAEHDFPAGLVARLKKTRLIRRKAKDILRASDLHLLPEDNPHVVRGLKKVRRGEALSPVLLVRGDFRRGVPLIVADGYHRICAGWYIDENALIPCRMVTCPYVA